MNEENTASCACGAVQFKATSRPFLQLICHCKDCQEASGSAFVRLVFFKLKSSESTGALSARRFQATSGNDTVRESCAACGALMYDRSEGFPAMIGVFAERLQAPFVFAPMGHVWTKSKQGGIEIPEGVKQCPENFTA